MMMSFFIHTNVVASTADCRTIKTEIIYGKDKRKFCPCFPERPKKDGTRFEKF